MKKNIENEIIRLIGDCAHELFPEAKEVLKSPYIEFPQDEKFGDISTNIAMRVSKTAGRPAREIALILKEKMLVAISSHTLKDCVADIRVEGAGFINFYFSPSYLYGELSFILKERDNALRLDLGGKKKVLIEFVSANPTGSLSVAHARQAAVGDALANLLNFLGFDVKKEYYLNDEGNQINILGKSVELRLKELSGEETIFPQDYYQGQYIYDIAKEAKAQNIPVKQMGDFAASCILSVIRKELDDFGVRFDCWYSQKDLARSGKIESSFAYLKEKGLLYDLDGALWFKSSAFGDDKDRVVIKSDGSYTYLAPDIAYHDDKFKRGFDWLINLWGPDHHGYIGRLKASVASFGRDPGFLSVLIVQLATISRNGKPVQMSTRRGEYITLREVLDEVGKDAARFFFMSRRISSHLDFDLEVAKKQTSENPVYYVQYAYARICSILRNNAAGLDAKAPLDRLSQKEEILLIKKLLQFSYVLNVCLSTQDPYMITVYLQEVAESFHKFYDLHRVLTDDKELSKARLALIGAVKIVLAAGLDILGISKPEKM